MNRQNLLAFFHHPQTNAAPLKQLLCLCSGTRNAYFRARLSAAPFKQMFSPFEVFPVRKSNRNPLNLPTPSLLCANSPTAIPVRSYVAAARMTRSSSARIPSGRSTSQLRWLSSTCNSMVARVGGWSQGDSTKRKSGPICAIRKLMPSKSSRIFTRAECPP